MKMEKSDIKLLVEEVIKERWQDFLSTQLPTILPLHRKISSSYKLYTTVDDWVKDMIDQIGNYIGPEFADDYKFKKGELLIDDMNDAYNINLMYIVMKWNELLKEKYPNIDGDVVEVNKMVKDNFMSDHEISILGDPPWPVYSK